MNEPANTSANKPSAPVNTKPKSEEPESKNTPGILKRFIRFLLGQKAETTLREVLDEVIE